MDHIEKKKKYLKYKIKYLKLKSFMTGGGESNSKSFSENKFGNQSSTKYPPCYEICGATRNIYDILEKNKLLEKYHEMLDKYSIVLCQEVFLKEKKCNNTMFEERYNNIKKNKNIPDVIQKKVKNIIVDKPKDKRMIKFLENITDVLEKNIKILKKDNNLSEKEKKKIIKMNDVFYQVHYNELSSRC
jgi:hypothetical protein